MGDRVVYLLGYDLREGTVVALTEDREYVKVKVSAYPPYHTGDWIPVGKIEGIVEGER